MNKPKYKTIGELKKSGYHSKTLNQEITDNLRSNLQDGKNVFSELIGYEDFMTGWLQREGTKEIVLGRPANVFQMQDGSLLISDDKANAIFRVSY